MVKIVIIHIKHVTSNGMWYAYYVFSLLSWMCGLCMYVNPGLSTSKWVWFLYLQVAKVCMDLLHLIKALMITHFVTLQCRSSCLFIHPDPLFYPATLCWSWYTHTKWPENWIMRIEFWYLNSWDCLYSDLYVFMINNFGTTYLIHVAFSLPGSVYLSSFHKLAYDA